MDISVRIAYSLGIRIPNDTGRYDIDIALFGFKAKITNLILERKGACQILVLPNII